MVTILRMGFGMALEAVILDDLLSFVFHLFVDKSPDLIHDSIDLFTTIFDLQKQVVVAAVDASEL